MLDQFYTHPDIAERYAGQVSSMWPDAETLFIEPSAGYGAFVNPLKSLGRNVRAMDIAPMAKGIFNGDFLAGHGIFEGSHSGIIVIGNPPFGKNANLAVRFFNHAAAHADAIAFIVPRTFRKMSVQKRLHRNFHLSWDKNVAPESFIVDGKPHDVPCAWQIWRRKNHVRAVPVPPDVDHLIRYTTAHDANFAMRRVGYYAGRVIAKNFAGLSGTTHYFIREMKAGVSNALMQVNWLDIVAQTAGVRSLSKSEIAFVLGEIYD